MMIIMMIPTTAIPMIAVVVKPPLPESVETVLGLVVGLVSVVGLAVLERSELLGSDSVLISEDKIND